MAEFEKVEYEFPDEVEAKEKEVVQEVEKESPDFEVEIEDDTPVQDRNRAPLPKEIVEELDKDSLDEYSDKVKIRLKQMKKVWHDERREKEAAAREREEALVLARKALDENKALKAKLSQGEGTLLESFKGAAVSELEMAKREYREAYEAGDADKLVEAQEKMTAAKMRVERVADAERFRKENALQTQEDDVQMPHRQAQTPVRDTKAASWQEKNTWFGQDDEMTSLALGLHEKLVKENGMAYATTDEYYKRIDQTMRKRFPENFEEEKTQEDVKPSQRTKPSTVVASASRSTSSKRITLTTSAQAIAKKLGLTNEQYARELMKMEAQNG
jgi:hypothetical protein